MFHSRLAVSPDGHHLLMAGWVWQPYRIGLVFDLQRALADSSTLDGHGIVPYEAFDAEVAAACWLDADRVVMVAGVEEPLTVYEPGALSSGQIGVWSIAVGAWGHRSTLACPAGTMIACGEHVVVLHGHPRMVDPANGAVIAEWPGVAVSTKSASYGVSHVPTPVAALRSDQRWLAVAQLDHIAIIDLAIG